ncbi:MarR family winged helix-turn-helix transcriptional regulator [Deinococcus cellulosilyticus]|uniref:MarR family transcriptional regulator n=1 Tax=Deinococcus cellulosilyticus (strain DSM 18568 / NBRC 106333 / KACC 11606 / 5516J-15) TaxID=1223518 RepID=A0A511MVP2_DEIC1|nr:MarR family transcriptional regulator [Deinococcus cellulosilyticus]GEM44653.1 MarR family transcriptional regulator [Deinococcus cellulosilyticus NBRC 106333 = KACC 11606]
MGTKFQGSDSQVQALNAYIKLHRAAATVETAANQHLLGHDLSLSQFSVLEALYHLGPLTQKQLGEKILKSKGNLTMVIDNLEKRGWAVRERSAKDRRNIHVNITPEGHELIASILPGHVAGIERVFSVLTPEELNTLSGLCRKLGLGLQGQSG